MATRRDYIGGPGNGPTLEEGANWADSIQWGSMANANNPVGTDLTPNNLTGYTAVLKVRETDVNGRVVLDASSFITITGITGTIAWNVPAANTTGLNFTTGVYALELTSPSGVVTRLIEGSVRYSPRVNR